jgi:redox-sensitive bicupin YhaK (pirin superfamily)
MTPGIEGEMIQIRRADKRGSTSLGWLDSRHTFSFGEYYDPAQMGFGPLRVINEDRVRPGAGFGTHSHRDMEIVSYVLDGALEHRDSLGTGSVIRPGDAQRMSAGSGIEHSEFNPDRLRPVHFLQIWIEPDQEGLPPSYEQKSFSAADRRGQLRLILSPDGRAESLRIHRDATIYAGLLQSGEGVAHALRPGRRAWLQVARGSVELNGNDLRAGDGAGITREPELVIRSQSPQAEILLLDLD